MADGDGYRIFTENLDTFHTNIHDESAQLAKNEDKILALAQLSMAAGEAGAMLGPVITFFAAHKTAQQNSTAKVAQATQGFEAYAAAAASIRDNYGNADAQGAGMINKLEKAALDMLFTKPKNAGDGDGADAGNGQDRKDAEQDLNRLGGKYLRENGGDSGTGAPKTEDFKAYEFNPEDGSMTVTTPGGNEYTTQPEDELDPRWPSNQPVLIEPGTEPPYQDGRSFDDPGYRVPEIPFPVEDGQPAR